MNQRLMLYELYDMLELLRYPSDDETNRKVAELQVHIIDLIEDLNYKGD